MSLFNKKSPKMKSESQLMKEVEKIISENPEKKYCGFFKDKERKSVALFVNQDESKIEITLLDLYMEYSQICAEISENKAIIKSLSISLINMGYGSLLMHEFLYQCKIHAITDIEGELYFSKLKNEDLLRIDHFFKKHEFEIQFDTKNTKAIIQWSE